MATEPIRLIIEYQPDTGNVNVTGPLASTFLCQGMLAEAKRIIERVADKRDEAKGNGGGPKIVIPQIAFRPPLER